MKDAPTPIRSRVELDTSDETADGRVKWIGRGFSAITASTGRLKLQRRRVAERLDADDQKALSEMKTDAPRASTDNVSGFPSIEASDNHVCIFTGRAVSARDWGWGRLPTRGKAVRWARQRIMTFPKAAARS
ncbi:MAG: hypothetical protein VX589_00530 [Myxococcota bacterium]|nr:hypothetical protein [Myxococcota bacterium]